MSLPSIQLIETIRVEAGRHAPLLARHWQRLQDSCAALDYAWPADRLLRDAQTHIGKLDADSSHRLRLLLSRNGDYSLESSPLPPTFEPVRLVLSATPLLADSMWLRHKSTHRPWYDEAQAWLLRNPEVFDIVFCNEREEVCEGSRSNIYILDPDSNTWLTPPLECGLLPGVQRRHLLDGGQVREARISRQQLLKSPAIRVSNALRGWLAATLDP